MGTLHTMEDALDGCPKSRAVAPRSAPPGSCPYCAEPLPDPRPAQCPHCREFLDALMLRRALEVERYNRCPGAVRGVATWFKFQGGVTLFSGVIALCAGFGEARPDLMPFGLLIALVGLGFWRVGSGVRQGKRWARSWAIGLSMVQIFSRGFIFGLACLFALNGAPARAYFAQRD